jgi:hypothetical protein
LADLAAREAVKHGEALIKRLGYEYNLGITGCGSDQVTPVGILKRDRP